MARKRKSSEMEPTRRTPRLPQATATATATPTGNGAELRRALQDFCRDADIQIQIEDTRSPAQSTGTKKDRFRSLFEFLYWRNRDGLQTAVNDFFRSLPKLPNSHLEETKVDLIFEMLDKLQVGTPRKQRCIRPDSSAVANSPHRFAVRLDPAQPDPPSPSPASSRRMNDFFTISKPVADGSNRTKKTKPDANTSFATTATKSFASVFSQLSRSSTQQTVATEVSSPDEEYHSARNGAEHNDSNADGDSMNRQSTDYLSSVSTNGAARLKSLLAEYEPPQTLDLIDIALRPGRSTDVTVPSPRASDWGSSIDTTSANWLQARADSIAGAYDIDSAMDKGHTENIQHSSKRSKACPPPSPAMRFTPAHGFAQLKIPSDFQDLPFLVQWEAQRLLQTGNIACGDLAERWRPRDLETLYEIADEVKRGFHKGFESEETSDLENITMGGKLQYTLSNNGSIFDLLLDAPKKEKSCDLQRKYGAERVLYIDIPSMSKPPDHHVGRDIISRFRDMACTPQRFLGQRWVLYVVQPNKKNTKSGNKDAAHSATHRLIFFAINNSHLRELFDYVVPYQENAHQPGRKLYTRLELMISRTTPTVQFDAADIEYRADDQLATKDPDDDRFLDPALRRQKLSVDPEQAFDPHKEMSDGCAAMSSWTYWQIHEALGVRSLRSAVQARIAGAKGVWFRSEEDYTSLDSKPDGTHIRLTKSQVKVLRGSLAGCDAGALTLNVVKVNSYARPSVLHSGFMPILLDRNVPRDAILDVVRVQIRAETQEFEQAVKEGREALRRWLHTQNQLFEERNRDNGISTLAGMPQRREEGIVQLLESGFDPYTCPYLAREIKLLAKQIFDMKRRNYKIRLNRSTTLMGISDPKGVLRPGEVHVNFSSPFTTHTGLSWLRLHNMEGLVARNPALAPWDIQKVRFVFKPELEHLSDLAIFPSKGRRPLAGMLQGGDYDGDTFWICWEPKLVQSFLNAPCPSKPPPEDDFNIIKRAEKLRSYVTDPDSEDQWCKWLEEMAVARMGWNLLGVVTKLHERLIYATGDIGSQQALSLAHLHDYLVDADKQGYDFGFQQLDEVRKQIKLPPNLPDPAYWEFTKLDDDDEPTTYAVAKSDVKGNIIDEALFGVVQPAIEESLKRLSEMLSVDEVEDPDLPKFFNETYTSSTDSPSQVVIHTELRLLKANLQQVRDFWGKKYRMYDWPELLKEVRLKYDSVQPQNSNDPVITEWLRKTGNDLTIWDKLKASAFAKYQHYGKFPGKVVFSVAGRELCVLKALYADATRTLRMDQYRMLKVRKQKKVETFDDYGSDHEDLMEDEPVEPTVYY